jgi:hypothetical protein
MLALVELWSAHARAQTPQSCAVYPVVIQGTVSDNFATQDFAVNEFLFVFQPGFAQNPVDFVLTSNVDLNSLSGMVQPGLITLMSNTRTGANVGASSQMLDVAAVSGSNGALQFRLEPSLGLQQPGVNTLAAPGAGQAQGGLGGLGFAPGFADFAQILGGSALLGVALLAPVQGGGTFEIQEGGVVGSLDIVAIQVDNPNVSARYIANVQGGPAQPCAQQTRQRLERKGARHGK